MSIGDFFPTPISYNKIYRNLNDKEIAFIHNEKNTAILNIGNFTSSNKYILDTDELKDLKILLTKYINDYFKTVFEPEEDIELYNKLMVKLDRK